MGSKIPLYHVDAFTDRPFKGNPAAVCFLKKGVSAAFMQSVAAEMNLSETAFLVPLGRVGGMPRYGLRWFTPTNEVSLCGHATLASAAVLFDGKERRAREIVFKTHSGLLRARRSGSRFTIDLPEHRPIPAGAPTRLLRVLGIRSVVGAVRCAEENLLLRLPDGTDIRALRPDFGALSRLRLRGISGIIVTVKGRRPYDFLSRYFTPWHGIPEDPVTGSAHCLLAPFWAGLLGKEEFRAFQASARGGDLSVRRHEGRVHLTGNAVILMKGHLG